MSAPARSRRIAIFGLSITSSWGNGHATTYRSLIKGLAARGHEVVFYERRQPWYEAHRDLRHSNPCEIVLYDSVPELNAICRGNVDADVAIVGSYVPEGIQVAEWLLAHTNAVTAFYDIDTPVTVAALDQRSCAYLSPALIPELDLYLSFAGGPVLDTLMHRYGARQAVPLYCSVDPEQYFPMEAEKLYDLAYLGTYSPDRQPKLDLLLTGPAQHWPDGRFCVAGPQYPREISWPPNVVRLEHVPPTGHCHFYNAQRFALNVTRRDMVASGFSPSVRLFEAAACGVPIVSDHWNGLERFFTPGREILIAESRRDVQVALRGMPPEQAEEIGARARARVLCEHTSTHRAMELERYVEGVRPGAGRAAHPDFPVTLPSSAPLQ
jgi:spore maturation protein CgeB